MQIDKKDELNEAIYDFLQTSALKYYLTARGFTIDTKDADFIDDNYIVEACEALTETYARHIKEN